MPHTSYSSIKAKRKEEEGKVLFLCDVCPPEHLLFAVKPDFSGSGWIWAADGKWMINHLFSFASAYNSYFCVLKLPLFLIYKEYFHLIFSSLSPAEEGIDKAVWWAPGIQPRSTYHKGTSLDADFSKGHFKI